MSEIEFIDHPPQLHFAVARVTFIAMNGEPKQLDNAKNVTLDDAWVAYDGTGRFKGRRIYLPARVILSVDVPMLVDS